MHLLKNASCLDLFASYLPLSTYTNTKPNCVSAFFACYALNFSGLTIKGQNYVQKEDILIYMVMEVSPEGGRGRIRGKCYHL